MHKAKSQSAVGLVRELLLRSQGHFQYVNLKASGQDHAFSLVNMENPQSCLGN